MSDSEQISTRAANLVASAEPHRDLRQHTIARVALARTGVSLATRHSLEFSLAHAQARDAVHSALSTPSLMGELSKRNLDPIVVSSAVSSRAEFLRRPDLGRRLSASAKARIVDLNRAPKDGNLLLSVILADGLSALAVERHALPLLDAMLRQLGFNTQEAPVRPSQGWGLAPVVVAEQGRVGLGDEIGAAIEADITVMLIGERPGLSSPASLGAYLTWKPRAGCTDAERNCVSNIHPEGLDYVSAAVKITWLMAEARRLGLSGVDLRDTALPSSRILPSGRDDRDR